MKAKYLFVCSLFFFSGLALSCEPIVMPESYSIDDYIKVGTIFGTGKEIRAQRNTHFPQESLLAFGEGSPRPLLCSFSNTGGKTIVFDKLTAFQITEVKNMVNGQIKFKFISGDPVINSYNPECFITLPTSKNRTFKDLEEKTNSGLMFYNDRCQYFHTPTVYSIDQFIKVDTVFGASKDLTAIRNPNFPDVSIIVLGEGSPEPLICSFHNTGGKTITLDKQSLFKITSVHRMINGQIEFNFISKDPVINSYTPVCFITLSSDGDRSFEYFEERTSSGLIFFNQLK